MFSPLELPVVELPFIFSAKLEAVPLTVTPTPDAGVNVWFPVHVGAIACDNAGAPSLRSDVAADPLIAVKPMVAVGLPVPAPAGAAHVPSPRQNVVLEAAVPPFKFVAGRLPVTPPAPEAARLIAGTSAPTIDRRDTAPVEPFGVATN